MLHRRDRQAVAPELKHQGLIPVYVGVGAKKARSSSSCRAFGGGSRRDVLFFTQELSTLLNCRRSARSRAVDHQRTDRARRRSARRAGRHARAERRQVAGRQSGDASRRISPTCTSTWCARAKLGILAQIFERLAEFERTRDDLRELHHLVDDLSGAAGLVGLGSIFVLLTFVVPRFAQVFEDSRMKIPAAHADHAGGQQHRDRRMGGSRLLALMAGVVCIPTLHRARRRDACGGTDSACICPCWAMRCGRRRRRDSRARWRRWWPTVFRWCSRSRIAAAF